MSGTFIVWYRTSELIKAGSSPVGIVLGLAAVILAVGLVALSKSEFG